MIGLQQQERRDACSTALALTHIKLHEQWRVVHTIDSAASEQLTAWGAVECTGPIFGSVSYKKTRSGERRWLHFYYYFFCDISNDIGTDIY
jgi:N-glycosylase/DNA lyase